MIHGEVDGGGLVRFWSFGPFPTRAEVTLATFRNEIHELRSEALLPALCVNFDENAISVTSRFCVAFGSLNCATQTAELCCPCT